MRNGGIISFPKAENALKTLGESPRLARKRRKIKYDKLHQLRRVTSGMPPSFTDYGEFGKLLVNKFKRQLQSEHVAKGERP